jgi:hypothetical protein
MSIFIVVIVIVIRLVFDGRDDGAFVGIDLYIEDFGSSDDFHLIDPTLLRFFVLCPSCLAIGMPLGCQNCLSLRDSGGGDRQVVVHANFGGVVCHSGRRNGDD